MFTKQYVQTATFASEKGEQLIEKLRNEDGEIASWMIVLAFLVGAAALAKEQIKEPLENLVKEVGGKIA